MTNKDDYKVKIDTQLLAITAHLAFDTILVGTETVEDCLEMERELEDVGK